MTNVNGWTATVTLLHEFWMHISKSPEMLHYITIFNRYGASGSILSLHFPL